jgi:hypothetical protein
MVVLRYPEVEKFRMHGYTYENLKDARRIVEKKEQSFIIINDGKTGLGKSTLSIQQAFFFARGDRKKFNQEHVLYDPNPSFDKVANSKKGDVWIFDESIIFNSRSAMSQYNKDMILLLSTIRSKQIYIILNIPSFFDLDRAITMNLANILFHLYGECFGDRGRYLVFDDKRMKDLFIKGKKTYTYGLVKANFRADFGPGFLLDKEIYDAEKAKAINNMRKKVKKSLNKKVLQRDFLLAYLTQKLNISYNDINKLIPEELRFGISTVSDALVRIRDKYDPEWFKKRKL